MEMGQLLKCNDSLSVLLALGIEGDAERVRTVLGAAGHYDLKLHFEETLRGAVDILESRLFDLVLLDLGHVENGAMETLAKVRTAAGQVPVVVLCSCEDPDLVDRMAALGARACLARHEIEKCLLHVLYTSICEAKLYSEVRAAHQCVEKLVGEAQDAILVLDQTGTILFANPAARQLFLVPCERLVGGTFGYPAVTGDVTELDVPRVGGTIRTVEMRVSNTEWHGKAARLVIFRDVTDRKLSEIALRRAHDELERRVEQRTAQLAEANRRLLNEAREREMLAENLRRSNEDLQQFAFIASHDLKEPLRKILTFSGMVLAGSGDSLDAKTRDYIQRMGHAVTRMQKLIDSLLRYCRVSTYAVPFECIALREVVDEVVSDLEHQIERSKASVEMEDLPIIDADPNQMYQLFQNLVQNALKFRGDSDPRIRICHAVESEWESDRLAGPVPCGMCRILIQDNGIGFDEQHVERIFGLFQRLHGRGEYEGTGMGLAICKRIVERHGGTITARSIPGEGTTFILTLPRKQQVEHYSNPVVDRKSV